MLLKISPGRNIKEMQNSHWTNLYVKVKSSYQRLDEWQVWGGWADLYCRYRLPSLDDAFCHFFYVYGRENSSPCNLFRRESTCPVISVPFIIANSNRTMANCNLLWEGVTCDRSQHFDLIQSFVITTSFLGIFGEQASGARCNVFLLIPSPEDVRLPWGP